MTCRHSSCVLDAGKVLQVQYKCHRQTNFLCFLNSDFKMPHESKHGFPQFCYRTVIFPQEILGWNKDGYLQWLKLYVRDFILLLLKSILENAQVTKLSSYTSMIIHIYIYVLCFYLRDCIVILTHTHAGVMQMVFSSSRILKHKLVNKQKPSWFLKQKVLPNNLE